MGKFSGNVNEILYIIWGDFVENIERNLKKNLCKENLEEIVWKITEDFEDLLKNS